MNVCVYVCIYIYTYMYTLTYDTQIVVVICIHVHT